MSLSTTQRVYYRDAAMKGLDLLPPFSPVLNHLMSSLSDEDVSFARLAAVIERDTVLCGNVLRLVNSALYGRRGTVSSVRAAVSILGLNKLRNYLLGLSVSRLWANVRTPPTWDMARFNDHSVATAVFADLLVQKTEVDYPEGAFVAGLLHDLGRIMIALVLPEEFEQIRQMHEDDGRPLEDCEQELLSVTHSELSAMALSRWNLPAQIQKAVLYHHSSSLDPSPHAPGAMPLSRVVEISNIVAACAGHPLDSSPVSLQATEALSRIGLEHLESELMAALAAELHAVRSSI